MKKLILSTVVAAALAGSAYTLAVAAAPDNSDGPARHHMADRGFLLDAKLAGMKAALNLTADQQKLWTPFETAVREGVKARREARRAWRETRDDDKAPSPIDRMTHMSDSLAQASQVLKQVAQAAKPLYDSLNDDQKDRFGPLLHMLRAGGQRHGRG
jgi:Spy/CpxP family protein refolding chaperone